MKECVLTVSVAAYNVSQYLRDTLDSLIFEDEESAIEVLIVNDGSKDQTAEIALKYVNKYPGNFRLINKENGGWGSTVNTGIQNARGKYFKQLDGDDYFEKSNLKAYVNFLRNCNADLVISPFHSFSNLDGSILERCRFDEMLMTEQKIESVIEQYPNLQMHAACYKTSVLRENGIALLEHCFYTDMELSVKAVSRCSTVAYFNQDVYCYRLDREGQSMSWSSLLKHYKDHERVARELVAYCEAYNEKQEVKKVIEARVFHLVELSYYLYFRLDPMGKYKKEFVEYDRWMKNHPSFYGKLSSRRLKLCRALGYCGYTFILRTGSREEKIGI